MTLKVVCNKAWKKENDIVTNYKTPKDEYKKYVEEFLEDLENQIDSV